MVIMPVIPEDISELKGNATQECRKVVCMLGLIMRPSRKIGCVDYRGGSRNSLRGGGGGFWARILRRGVQVRGNFHIMTSKKKKKTSEGGGGLNPLIPPLDPLLDYHNIGVPPNAATSKPGKTNLSSSLLGRTPSAMFVSKLILISLDI